jgi:hypothetical protein
LDLIYDNRIDTGQAGFGGAISEVGFDARTDISFNMAAVPEPSTFALLAIGCLACFVLIRHAERFTESNYDTNI